MQYKFSISLQVKSPKLHIIVSGLIILKAENCILEIKKD